MDFTTNVKGTSIGRKHKKRHTKINPKTIKKIQINMNTYCKYKWIKIIHQKCTDCFNGYKKKIHIYINRRYTHKIELFITQSSVSSDTEDIIKTKNSGI